MPHERLNALLASFIPLLPLLYQHQAQEIDWGKIVTRTKPFAPKYLPPVPELPKDQALASFYSHAYTIDFTSSTGWLRVAISQPLERSLPVVDALGAFRSHFQVNVVSSTLLLWGFGLLLLGLVAFLDRANIPPSSYDNMFAEPSPEGSSATRSLTQASTSTSAEPVNPKLIFSWLRPSNETVPPLPPDTATSMPSPFAAIEEEECIERAAPHPQPDAVEDSDQESALRYSSSSHTSSVPFFRSSPAITPNISPLALLQGPLTPSRPFQSTHLLTSPESQLAGKFVGEQLCSPLVDKPDASSTSSDFVFTIISPSISDLDSAANSGSPSPSQDQIADTCLPLAISASPSAADPAQTSPSLPSLPKPVSLIPRFGERQPGLQDVLDSRASLELADEANVGDVHVSEPITVPTLGEDPRPTVQELGTPPSPAHFRSLSNITEITEPSDSSDSTPGTPRVEWFSGIHGRLVSSDDRGLTFQGAQEVADDATVSTPEADSVRLDWSQIDIPSSMEDFLPLSTSTPNLQSAAAWQPEPLSDSPGSSHVQRVSNPGLLDDFAGVRTFELLHASLAGPASLLSVGIPLSPSAIGRPGLEDGDDEDGWSFEDCTAIPPIAPRGDVSSNMEGSPSQRPAITADEAAEEIPGSTAPSPPIAQKSPIPSSPGGSCRPSALSEAPVTPTLPATNSTDTILDRQLQTDPAAPSNRATPVVTHVRRASRVSGIVDSARCLGGCLMFL